MVTTSVAARGLDVRSVMHVINFDLPTASARRHRRVRAPASAARHASETRALATSFFNESNSDIADDLIAVLEECNQKVQDFIEAGR